MDLKQKLCDYVAGFNADDEENVINAIPNSEACEWMLERIPRVAIPDQEIERTYYFRWWTYRKHICKTPEGYVLNEFNTPKIVSWCKRYNAIACACAHHVDEGRWLRENEFLKSYIRFWYDGDYQSLHKYGNWLEAAVIGMCLLRGDTAFAEELFPQFVESYRFMEKKQGHQSGAFFSIDDRDGQEYSVGGSGIRPTVNSYRYGCAKAIAALARILGKDDIAKEFEQKAETVAEASGAIMWDEKARFYKTFALEQMDYAAPLPYHRRPHEDARELCGYIPWRFHMAPVGREDAFKQLFDPEGFMGKVDASTCERRHSDYLVTEDEREFNLWMHRYDHAPYDWGNDPENEDSFRRRKLKGEWMLTEGLYHMHGCQWNGPTWAYSTSLMLGGVAALLTDYPPQDTVTPEDFIFLLHRYAAGHKLTREDGKTVMWIDESQNPDTGEWITRSIYLKRKAANPDFCPGGGTLDRGKDYNHSTFCDLVLSGVFGIRPEENGVRICPLIPKDWDYAHLEGVPMLGHIADIHYSRGEGYRIDLDGRTVFKSEKPETFFLKR